MFVSKFNLIEGNIQSVFSQYSNNKKNFPTNYLQPTEKKWENFSKQIINYRKLLNLFSISYVSFQFICDVTQIEIDFFDPHVLFISS